jgi:hypothetical protein
VIPAVLLDRRRERIDTVPFLILSHGYSQSTRVLLKRLGGNARHNKGNYVAASGVRSHALIKGLRRVEKGGLDTFENAFIAAIDSLLAADAERRPWHHFQAPLADFLLAVHAGAEVLVVDSAERQRDVAANFGIPVKTDDREFPLRLVLDLLDRVGASFDRDAFQTRFAR